MTRLRTVRRVPDGGKPHEVRSRVDRPFVPMALPSVPLSLVAPEVFKESSPIARVPDCPWSRLPVVPRGLAQSL